MLGPGGPSIQVDASTQNPYCYNSYPKALRHFEAFVPRRQYYIGLLGYFEL